MMYRTTLSAPVFGLRRELDRLMDETLGVRQNPDASASWGPAVDVSEDQDGLLLEFELPGLRPDQVEITAEKGVLSVRGEKQTSRSRDGVRGVITERSAGRFVRAIQLPQGVDESKIDAEFTDGVLRVRVPRAALPQPRKVQIRTGANREVSASTEQTESSSAASHN